MARTPKLVLDEDAVKVILSLSPAQRSRMLKLLDQLRTEHPRQTEDFVEYDETGRHVSVKSMSPVMVHYWLDGPADEFRVTKITMLKAWRR